jgi:hypothetical protein
MAWLAGVVVLLGCGSDESDVVASDTGVADSTTVTVDSALETALETALPVDSTSVDTTVSDAPTDAKPDVGADTKPVRCHELVYDGDGVVVANASGSPPAATGGTLVDGTYLITASAQYGATAAEVDMAIMVFAGGKLERFDDFGRSAQTYATTGTSIKLTTTCGDAPTMTIPFTATSTTYTEHLPMLGGTRVRTYTKK